VQPAPVGSAVEGTSPGVWYLGRVWFRGPGLSLHQLAVAFEDRGHSVHYIAEIEPGGSWKSLPTPSGRSRAGTQFPSLEQAEVELLRWAGRSWRAAGLRREARCHAHGPRAPAGTGTGARLGGAHPPWEQRGPPGGVSLPMAPAPFAAAQSVASPPAAGLTARGTPVVAQSHRGRGIPAGHLDPYGSSQQDCTRAALQAAHARPVWPPRTVLRIANQYSYGTVQGCCGTRSTARVGAYPHWRLMRFRVLLRGGGLQWLLLGSSDPFGGHTPCPAFLGTASLWWRTISIRSRNCATTVDALQPCGSDWLRPQVVVTSPPFDLLDLVAPSWPARLVPWRMRSRPWTWLASPRVRSPGLVVRQCLIRAGSM
jgi:hypothetical protein